MIYTVRVKKKASNIKVYTVLRRIGGNENIITRLLTKLVLGRKKESGLDR